jgi:hypothetical protein
MALIERIKKSMDSRRGWLWMAEVLYADYQGLGDTG